MQKAAGYYTHRVLSHVAETKRLLEILKQTLERKFPPDERVTDVLEGIDLELSLVDNAVQKLGGN